MTLRLAKAMCVHMLLSVQCITEATLAGMLALSSRARLEAREATEPMLLTCAYQRQPCSGVRVCTFTIVNTRVLTSQDAVVPRRHGLQVKRTGPPP